MFRLIRVCFVFVAVVGSVGPADAQPFQFRNVASESGLMPAAKGIHGHGAGWGDVDGDGWADLYIATFHYGATKPNLFFRNRDGRFSRNSQSSVRISGRGTGVVFADFDNDGDLDLYVASMPAPSGSKPAEKHGRTFSGCSIFRNLGNGTFTDNSRRNESCPVHFAGRSVAVLDYNGDGLLDLLVGQDPVSEYDGSETRRSRLFKNLGGMRFADVSVEAGIPAEAAGLGVAVGDVNADTYPDLFLASTLGNYLLINDGQGRFSEPAHARESFSWPDAKGDDMVCGVTIADVNGDIWPDIVIGQHYDSPWKEPVANRLYLNRGVIDDTPRFVDATVASNLIPLPMKAPHVEIQDFDNDGRQDIYTSIVMFAGDEPHPLVFRNVDQVKGIPRFEQYALDVNDFPTAADKGLKRSSSFFQKMTQDRKVFYSATGPTCDFDRDGRLDMVLASWFVDLPTLLLKNTTSGGNWLQVAVNAKSVKGMNGMGIGARVDVYEAGKAQQHNALLGSREIQIGQGYASGQEALVHFGLGVHQTCDLVVTLPHRMGVTIQREVDVNQRLTFIPDSPKDSS